MRRIAQVFGNGESPEPSPIWHSHDPNTGLQIQQEGADYYDILERTQKATMDITPWMDWFLGCLGRAIEGAQATLRSALSKAHFWETFGDSLLNERQHRRS